MPGSSPSSETATPMGESSPGKRTSWRRRSCSPPSPGRPAAESLLKCKVECKGVQTGVKVQTSARINPRDYVALPAEKDEPASAAAGRRRRFCGAGGSTSATTVSKRQSGRQGASLSPECLTRERLSARRSSSGGVRSATGEERSTARRRQRSARSATPARPGGEREGGGAVNGNRFADRPLPADERPRHDTGGRALS